MPRQLNLLDPNWDWFSTVWVVATVAILVTTAPVGLPGLLLQLSFRLALQAGKNWLVSSAIKGAIVAYALICVQIGGGGGGSQEETAESAPATVGTTVPASVVIHFDDALLDQRRVHARIDDQLVEAEDVEAFLVKLEVDLKRLLVGGCKEVIIDLEPYPGPDIERQVKAVCGNVGIAVSESNSAWGDDDSPEAPEAGK